MGLLHNCLFKKVKKESRKQDLLMQSAERKDLRSFIGIIRSFDYFDVAEKLKPPKCPVFRNYEKNGIV